MQNLIPTITREQIRAEQVRLWGEDKVRANEADVARRFQHVSDCSTCRVAAREADARGETRRPCQACRDEAAR